MGASFIIAFLLSIMFAAAPDYAASQPRSAPQNEKPRPTPERTPVARTDTLKPVPEKKEKTLPTIQMKNYVIKGEVEIDIPDPEKAPTDPQRMAQQTLSPEVDDYRSTRSLTMDPEKPIRTFSTPERNRMNSFHLGYGRYNDISIAGQAARTYNIHEGMAEINFHHTSGFIENANEATGKLRLGDAFKMHPQATGTLDLQYDYSGYRFYGAQNAYRNMKRTLQHMQGNAGLDFHPGDKATIGIIAGGMLGEVEDDILEDVGNNSLWGTLQTRVFMGRYMINASVDAARYSYEGTFRGDLPSGYFPNFTHTLKNVKAQIGIEGTILQGLHISLGGAFFGITNERNNIDYSAKISRFYPFASLSKALPEIGEIFGEFKPEVRYRTLMDWMGINRYLDPTGMISYTKYPVHFRGGWRKRAPIGVTLEVAYLYSKAENLGIEEDLDDSDNSGVWSLHYSDEYNTTLQGIQAVADWWASDHFSLWGTASVLDYSKFKNISGGNIPYHANISSSGTAQFRPGGGFRLELAAKYIGSRYADIWGFRKLDPYFLANFHIGKRFGKNIEVGISIYNLFNQKYEIRNLYREPDMVSSGIVKMYW